MTVFREGFLSYFRELEGRLQNRSPLGCLAFVCLIGFLVSSPFSISLSQIFIFAGIGAWIFSLWKESDSQRRQFPIWVPMALFATLTLLSAFLSDDPARSLKDARQLIQMLIFFFTIHVIQDMNEGVWLTKALIAATTGAALFALGIALTSSIGLANRMAGFYSIYMTFAGFLVIVGALALSYVVLPKDTKRSFWIFPAAVLILGALISTFSRNAWLGISAAAIGIIVATRRWKWGIWLAVGAVILILLSPATVKERIASIGNPEDVTARERVYMWKSGLQMVKERPFFGFGLDMIKRSYSRFANQDAIKKRTGHLHNNLLHIAAERGLLALAAWLWIWTAFYISVFRRRRFFREGVMERRILVVGGAAAMTGFLVAGLFEYNFGDSEVVMMAYFAMALPFVGEDPTSSLTEER